MLIGEGKLPLLYGAYKGKDVVFVKSTFVEDALAGAGHKVQPGKTMPVRGPLEKMGFVFTGKATSVCGHQHVYWMEREALVSQLPPGATPKLFTAAEGNKAAKLVEAVRKSGWTT
jgi:hypothetical protein